MTNKHTKTVNTQYQQLESELSIAKVYLKQAEKLRDKWTKKLNYAKDLDKEFILHCVRNIKEHIRNMRKTIMEKEIMLARAKRQSHSAALFIKHRIH